MILKFLLTAGSIWLCFLGSISTGLAMFLAIFIVGTTSHPNQKKMSSIIPKDIMILLIKQILEIHPLYFCYNDSPQFVSLTPIMESSLSRLEAQPLWTLYINNFSRTKRSAKVVILTIMFKILRIKTLSKTTTEQV